MLMNLFTWRAENPARADTEVSQNHPDIDQSTEGR